MVVLRADCESLTGEYATSNLQFANQSIFAHNTQSSRDLQNADGRGLKQS
jgi:hypothetical protein